MIYQTDISEIINIVKKQGVEIGAFDEYIEDKMCYRYMPTGTVIPLMEICVPGDGYFTIFNIIGITLQNIETIPMNYNKRLKQAVDFKCAECLKLAMLDGFQVGGNIYCDAHYKGDWNT